MFLGAFERVFRGLQKTGLNQSRPVNVNRFFCGLYISKKKRPDLRSGLLRSWSGLVTVFFRSRDRTSKHYSAVDLIALWTSTRYSYLMIGCCWVTWVRYIYPHEQFTYTIPDRFTKCLDQAPNTSAKSDFLLPTLLIGNA